MLPKVPFIHRPFVSARVTSDDRSRIREENPTFVSKVSVFLTQSGVAPSGIVAQHPVVLKGISTPRLAN